MEAKVIFDGAMHQKYVNSNKASERMCIASSPIGRSQVCPLSGTNGFGSVSIEAEDEDISGRAAALYCAQVFAGLDLGFVILLCRATMVIARTTSMTVLPRDINQLQIGGWPSRLTSVASCMDMSTEGEGWRVARVSRL
jgi:hypothetical protein